MNEQRRLYRLVFITAPLLALYNMIPMALFFNAISGHVEISEAPSVGRVIMGFTIFTLSVLLQWFINLWIYRWKRRHYPEAPSIYWYLFSFLAIFTFVTVAMWVAPNRAPVEIGALSYYPFFGVASNNIIILILINLVMSQRKRAQLELEKAQLEIAHLVAKQEQLKQQIHPHFLFNCMSNLRFLIQENPKQATQYSDQLAAFLRTSLSLGQSNTVQLEAELDFLLQYLDLQKVRFGAALTYSVQLSESIRQSEIPVFTLQILAENAIKHNALSKDQPLLIEIIGEHPSEIQIRNNLLPKFEAAQGTGIGLKNLMERYALLGLPKPKVERTDEFFMITIQKNNQ